VGQVGRSAATQATWSARASAESAAAGRLADRRARGQVPDRKCG